MVKIIITVIIIFVTNNNFLYLCITFSIAAIIIIIASITKVMVTKQPFDATMCVKGQITGKDNYNISNICNKFRAKY